MWTDDAKPEYEDQILMEWSLAGARRFHQRLVEAEAALFRLADECEGTDARNAIKAFAHSLVGFDVGIQAAIELGEKRALELDGVDKEETEEE